MPPPILKEKSLSPPPPPASRGSYLVQADAPDALLPAPIRPLGAQAFAAGGVVMAGRGAGQRGGRLHRHWGDIEERVAEAGPVVGGLHTEDAPSLP